MPLKPYQQKILQLYEDQERCLARLYTAFGQRFADDKAFWEQLVREETIHAQLLSKLAAAVEREAVIFDEGKVKTYTLSAMIARIEILCQEAEAGNIDRPQALAQTFDLESALIEKGAFSRFEALTDKARAVLKRLSIETLDHVARVRRMRDAATAGAAPTGEAPVASAPSEALIQWTPALSVNDARLDDQHRLLFAIINDLAMLRREGGGRERVISLITRMIRFSDAHFSCEDDVMIEADFPLFATHRREHQVFMERLGRFLEGCQQGHREVTGEMMAFLSQWWLRHTAESDRKYARWIGSQGKRAAPPDPAA